MLNRRRFVVTAAALAASPRCVLSAKAQPTTRPNIAEIDRIRILAAASVALARTSAPDLLSFSLDVPVLAAAAHLEPGEAAPWMQRASTLLNDFLLRLTPTAGPLDIADRAALAEVVVALPFLALAPDLKSEIAHWLSRYLVHLTEDRTPLLMRDARNHDASAWLLQVSAMARYLHDDKVFTDCVHRYKTSAIRAQIRSDGFFPQELTTPDPYRNSLFNLDMLAGVCQLLSTRFDSVWDHELQDGPGMRAAVARHAPYIASRSTWPYPADASHFSLLPARRPALVFAARAYNQADYAVIWTKLSPDQPTDRDLLLAFPIRQPLLWLAQPRPQGQS